jgi:hypothetical protein
VLNSQSTPINRAEQRASRRPRIHFGLSRCGSIVVVALGLSDAGSIPESEPSYRFSLVDVTVAPGDPYVTVHLGLSLPILSARGVASYAPSGVRRRGSLAGDDETDPLRQRGSAHRAPLPAGHPAGRLQRPRNRQTKSREDIAAALCPPEDTYNTEPSKASGSRPFPTNRYTLKPESFSRHVLQLAQTIEIPTQSLQHDQPTAAPFSARAVNRQSPLTNTDCSFREPISRWFCK